MAVVHAKNSEKFNPSFSFASGRFRMAHLVCRVVPDKILFATMNKRAKLLDAMRNNPRDWVIDDLLVVARQFDIECRNSGGSHHVFSFPCVERDVTVPAHRPIKPVYIRHFLLLVEAVKEFKK